jgi:hypothetical protein
MKMKMNMKTNNNMTNSLKWKKRDILAAKATIQRVQRNTKNIRKERNLIDPIQVTLIIVNLILKVLVKEDLNQKVLAKEDLNLKDLVKEDLIQEVLAEEDPILEVATNIMNKNTLTNINITIITDSFPIDLSKEK